MLGAASVGLWVLRLAGSTAEIQKDSYRQVLRIMAEKGNQFVTKEEIKAKFKGKTSTLDNALHALRDRKVIRDKEGARGVYRLQHSGFALWIKLFTANPSDLQTQFEESAELAASSDTVL